MKETTFTAVLARINFPPHVATYESAIRGHPLSNSRWLMRPLSNSRWLVRPMGKKDALRLARMCMWHMLLRRWKKFKKP